MMKMRIQFLSLLAIGGLMMAQLVGCEKAAETAKDAADKAENVAGEAAGEVGDMAKKAGDAAKDVAESSGEALSNLGEKAMGFLDPLKAEFGKLGGLRFRAFKTERGG